MEIITRIADCVWMVSPLSAPRYPYSNSLFIKDEQSAVIDFGAGAGYKEIDKEAVRVGLISHFHFDHLHCNVLFPNAKFMAGYEERQTYTCEEVYLHFHGYDLWDELMPDVPRNAFGRVVPLADDVPVQPGFRMIELSRTFSDQEIIDLGRRKVMVVHLPGHTAGHYGFYLEEEGILYSGDIDLVAAGPWYNSASGDVGDLIRSVQRIKEINPNLIVPAHRRIQENNIKQQLDHYIQVVLDRENMIFDLVRTPTTIQQLSRHELVFPNPQNPYELFWEKMTIRNHLLHLIKIGTVEMVDNKRYVQV